MLNTKNYIGEMFNANKNLGNVVFKTSKSLGHSNMAHNDSHNLGNVYDIDNIIGNVYYIDHLNNVTYNASERLGNIYNFLKSLINLNNTREKPGKSCKNQHKPRLS